MKFLTILAVAVIFLSSCGGSKTPPTPSVASNPAKAPLSPIPDDIGLVMQCNKCVFLEDQGIRYVAGQAHSDAKQSISGYVLSVDLQDAQGKSVRKIDGLMTMNAIILEPGESKDFKDSVNSKEPTVTQAVVYFKKAGRDVRLSNPLTLKLNAPAATATAGKPLTEKSKQ